MTDLKHATWTLTYDEPSDMWWCTTNVNTPTGKQFIIFHVSALGHGFELGLRESQYAINADKPQSATTIRDRVFAHELPQYVAPERT